VEPAKDWRSDCLAEQNLPVGELCGVLVRLQSIERLTQTNNNAKLNKGAKHITKLLIKVQKRKDGCKEGGKGGEDTTNCYFFLASLFWRPQNR
jgi:hypothetical protein